MPDIHIYLCYSGTPVLPLAGNRLPPGSNNKLQ